MQSEAMAFASLEASMLFIIVMQVAYATILCELQLNVNIVLPVTIKGVAVRYYTLDENFGPIMILVLVLLTAEWEEAMYVAVYRRHADFAG
jgi:hypothetical protein